MGNPVFWYQIEKGHFLECDVSRYFPGIIFDWVLPPNLVSIRLRVKSPTAGLKQILVLVFFILIMLFLGGNFHFQKTLDGALVILGDLLS